MIFPPSSPSPPPPLPLRGRLLLAYGTIGAGTALCTSVRLYKKEWEDFWIPKVKISYILHNAANSVANGMIWPLWIPIGLRSAFVANRDRK